MSRVYVCLGLPRVQFTLGLPKTSICSFDIVYFKWHFFICQQFKNFPM